MGYKILHSEGADSIVIADSVSHDDIAEISHNERHTVNQTVEQALELLEALVKLHEAGRTAWHFQHQDTNAQLGFATALTHARAAIAKATSK